jgi:transposase
MIDELKIIETIDNNIEQDLSQRNLSVGECVKILILNGLGFINHQLYLVSDFMKDKPIERLMGRAIEIDQINDDVLGRALDSLYDHGIADLFTLISRKASNILELGNQRLHADATSFHLHGDYSNPSEENSINIVRGYSRDHHPELKQVVLDMIVSNASGIPLAMKALSGNSCDKKDLPKIINNYIENLSFEERKTKTVIADSALYSSENLKNFPDGMKFITRVVETIKQIKSLYREINKDDFINIDDNYSYQEFTSDYAGVKQRWIVYNSQAAYSKKSKTFDKNIEKKVSSETKKFNKLCKKTFACEVDAKQALDDFISSCIYIDLSSYKINQKIKHASKGRPSKKEKPQSFTYSIEGIVEKSQDKIAQEKSKLGFFTLATNHLEEYSAEEILTYYKEQGYVERGFRFLKDRTFLASSMFLKKPERIEGLMMIMCLCLTTYASLEYRIRKGLKEKNLTFKNQVKKDVSNPTARWVFFCFKGIHELKIENKRIVLNKEQRHRRILSVLGKKYKTTYS